MKIDTRTMVSITEANQNFSKVARLVDEMGSAVIMKNNAPKYVILEFNQDDDFEYISYEELMKVHKKLCKINEEAYRKLSEWNKLITKI